MGEMADMMIDNFLFNEMEDWFNTYDVRLVTREERKEAWERAIRNNEEYGVWQLGGKNPKKIKFQDMTFDHMFNVYEMLRRNKMYIPAFIRNTVENPNKGALDQLVIAKRLVGETVIVVPKCTSCSECDLVFFSNYEPAEDYWGSGDNKWHCKITNEDVNYQHKYEKRGVLCPLKDVI